MPPLPIIPITPTKPITPITHYPLPPLPIKPIEPPNLDPSPHPPSQNPYLTAMTLPPAYLPLKGYMGEDGRFQQLPGKRQKKMQLLMLQYLAEKFRDDVYYTEEEVNDILNIYHSFDDPASLRRFMIGKKLLERTNDGREYWKPESKAD